MLCFHIFCCVQREVVEVGEAIFEVSRNGEANEVKALLRRGGGSVKYRDQYGLTALHAAAFKGYKDVMKVLIELGGLDLECEDEEEGHVPLHMAVESGDVETVQVLVEKGVNLNVVNKRGATLCTWLEFGDTMLSANCLLKGSLVFSNSHLEVYFSSNIVAKFRVMGSLVFSNST